MPDTTDHAAPFQPMLDDVAATHLTDADGPVDREDVEERTWAVLGAALDTLGGEADSTPTDVLLTELVELINLHDRPGLAVALTLLCEAVSGPLRIQHVNRDVVATQVLVVETTEVTGGITDARTVAKANYWAGLALTAALAGDGLALANVISDITDDAMVAVLDKVARYVASVVEAMATLSGTALDARDERRRQRELRNSGGDVG